MHLEELVLQRCPRVHFVVVSVYLFLLKCMFNAKLCDLSFLNVEKFI